ncbi:MAG TPA: thioredoxin family protein [Aeromicrobium sp.]|nr:thioredoxin family protein [Aeromicrobium sp.]
MPGLITLGIAIAIAAVVALFLHFKNGRFASADSSAEDDLLSAGDLGADLGERATLVQFSSSFCAPCRATKIVLAQVVELVPGIATVEIDAESNLDLVRKLDILRTPTVLILDERGRIASRASGAPTKEQVLAALDAVIAGEIDSSS